MSSEQQPSSNTFTEEGRLLQAEFAIKNVSKAGTIIGMVCTDGVILLGINLAPASTIEKIYKINNTTYCAVSGIFSDALRLIKHARLESSNIAEEIGETPKISVLCDCVAEEIQKYTQYGGARPFGVSFLYCGIEDGKYALYSTDPSGTVNKWKAWAFGSDEEAINGSLRTDIPAEGLNMEEGLKFLLKSIKKVRECTEEIADLIEILKYNKDKAAMLSTEKVKEILSSFRNN